MGVSTRATTVLLNVSQCHEDEAKPLLLSFFGFGLVLASYFFLLPLRDEAGVALGSTALPILFAASLALTLLISPTASALLQRSPHKGAALQVLYRIIALTNLAFFCLYHLAGSPTNAPVSTERQVLTWPQRSARCAFYLWVSLANLVGVASVWARASDVFSPEASARLFGILGAGATSGQLVASLLAAGATRLPVFSIGGVSLVPMLLSAGCLEAAGHLAARVKITPAAAALVRMREEARARGLEGTADERKAMNPWSNFLRGLAVIRSSSYLQRICVFVVFNYFVSSLFYFEKTIIVARVPDAGARTTWFAMINSASAFLILALQLSLTGWAISWMGVGKALLVLPLSASALLLGVSALAVPASIALAEVIRKVLTYALARPTREVLFTILTREQKYGAKVFMDTIVQRIGDAGAAAVFATAVPALGLGPERLALCALPFCLGWSAVAATLGEQYRQAAAARVLNSNFDDEECCAARIGIAQNGASEESHPPMQLDTSQALTTQLISGDGDPHVIRSRASSYRSGASSPLD